RRRSGRHNDIDLLACKLCRKFVQALGIPLRRFVLDDDVLSIHIAKFSKLAHEGHGKSRTEARIEDTDLDTLLRACRKWPRHRAAEQRDELASPHSITSSAMASTPGGIVRLSSLAVLRLITNSSLVGCMTGRSAGFSPLRIRPVYMPAC